MVARESDDMDGQKMNNLEQVAKYLADRVDVVIVETDETGEWQWAIEVADDREFWLSAFWTRHEAQMFCNHHRLSVRPIDAR